MLFNSFLFIFFFLLVIPINYYLKGTTLRKILLVLFSYIFYGYWDWRFCLLLALSTTMDFYLGKFMYKVKDIDKRKHFVTVSVVVNLILLGIFKYFNFFMDSFIVMMARFGLEVDFIHINVILPVGISFYTFQSIAYVLDIYRKELVPTDSFLDYALFVAFFPQLVAGPIQRAPYMLPQIQKFDKPTWEQLKQGAALITIGMFKKIVIGDTSGRIVNHIFADHTAYSSPELMMALFLFSVQIYADFSGYSTIAIGTAKFLGVNVTPNFTQPYLSSNITEFWRRWHMSLSSWLRDYLYISLGGNRKGVTRTYINLMLTMLLGGLWHGANWTFIIWGALHGAYLAIHKWILGEKKPNASYKYENPTQFLKYLAGVIFTFILVQFAWLFFRAVSFEQAFYFIDKFINWEGSQYTGICFTITISFMFVTFLIDIVEYYTKDPAFILRINPSYRYGVAFSMWMVTLLYLFQSTPMPFIYFQF
jgi:alginate O-acetyltransferase complex protein AlgI